MFTVRLVGLTDLVVQFGALSVRVRSSVATKLIELTERLERRVKAKVSGPVLAIRGGALLGAIDHAVDTSGDTMRGRVFVGAQIKYAAIQEFGGTTPPHTIVPVKAQALAFLAPAKLGFSGGTRGNAMVFARRVNHPGSRMPERSYLRSTLAEMRSEIAAEFKAAVAEGLGVAGD